MTFTDFFKRATGNCPYPYQSKLAEEKWTDFLNVPTGMGKTAAVTLAWLYKRGWRQDVRNVEADKDTPCRLIWCLPMRVLVEQTESNIRGWLETLGILGDVGQNKVSVHVLMGGADNLKSWAEHPEEDIIIIGTQDMLLSRALMRGYGMSRYLWPMHFALLHNNCLWVYDEVQLMGAGLPTSAQLEAFRRQYTLAAPSRTLWVSATLNKTWLHTVDMQQYIDSLTSLEISDDDQKQVGNLLKASKQVDKAGVSFTKDAGNKEGLEKYLQSVSDLVLEQHDEDAQTLVIVNRVDRAQGLFSLLREKREGTADILIHGRFRAKERNEQAEALAVAKTDRIIVATQAIEAGVDISSKVLITELAPWSSMVQRFGRCNRYGEYPDNKAKILWVDITDDTVPYTAEDLAFARMQLEELKNASPAELPRIQSEQPLTAVLRRKDFLDLFNTDPDLSGFDVDVSDYIRDSGQPSVFVFWRNFEDPNKSNNEKPEGKPSREELCPVSIRQIKAFLKKKHLKKNKSAWFWDAHDKKWLRKREDEIRPGMRLLLSAAEGGYDTARGFDPDCKSKVAVIDIEQKPAEDSFADDPRSTQKKEIVLSVHLGNVAKEAKNLCQAVGEMRHEESIVRSGRWHDVGKAHWVFQKSMYHCKGGYSKDKSLLAKSECKGWVNYEHPYFRHELASMLAWLAQHDGEDNSNLIAYLILAHHGKVRMSLRAMPDEYQKIVKQISKDKDKDKDKSEQEEAAEQEESSSKEKQQKQKIPERFARGIWEGDTLPQLDDFDGEHSKETILKLALMEIGEGEQGISWTERSLKLLDTYGPFYLAWLETLVRLADWRASKKEQEEET